MCASGIIEKCARSSRQKQNMHASKIEDGMLENDFGARSEAESDGGWFCVFWHFEPRHASRIASWMGKHCMQPAFARRGVADCKISNVTELLCMGQGIQFVG